MKRLALALTFICSCLLPALSQNSIQGSEQSAVFVQKIDAEIKIDGNLDEASWKTGVPAVDFWEYFPSDSMRTDIKTEVYMTFDENYLYIGAICHSIGDQYVVPSLRRDFRAGGNDNLTFVLDPFKDKTNAFVFGMNPLGVRREALIANGGRRPGDFDESWDNKWKGASQIHDGYWSCELAIPFSTLRFKEGEKEWYFNCYRFDTQSNTRSTWSRIPQNQTIMDLAYMGKMIWSEPLKKPGANVSVIPYVAGNYDQDFEENEDPNFGSGIGGDAKIRVSSGLNLDLTFNPDFSQVEVDQQVINTDRFEIFFPERRQFFLENADLFNGFGSQRTNPFFSRRIGVSRDTSTGQNIQNTILGGARLSGKLDNNWRIGFLNMVTDKDERNGLPTFNYTVAAVQRKVFARSNIGMIFVNKQSVSDLERTDQDSSDLYNAYNRVIGLDYNLASADNRVTGKFFYHRAITTDQEAKNKFSHGARLNYQVRKFRLSYGHEWVGDGFDAEVGFVRRKDFFRINPEGRLFFYPKKGYFNQHGIGLRTDFLFRPELGKTDHQIRLFWDSDFRNTGGMFVSLTNQYIYLTDSFDPTRTDAQELPGDTGYNFTRFSVSFRTDPRKIFSFRVNPEIGQFFNGMRYGMGGSVTWRYQPLGSIQMTFDYNRIELPEPYGSASLFLIGPRIDLTFSKNLFWTTFLQYNSQIENFNVNTRLQWRFAPVSDFFLVYTDNYDTFDFRTKNRALVAKVTYWLNL
jgi:hypothetical protein